jgi:hypothetical protein
MRYTARVAELISMGSSPPPTADVAGSVCYAHAHLADSACCARPSGRARAGRPGGRGGRRELGSAAGKVTRSVRIHESACRSAVVPGHR